MISEASPKNNWQRPAGPSRPIAPTLNRNVWWPAAMTAGTPQERRNGMHAVRHYYAAVLLDGGVHQGLS
jgi:hypothetical protein